MTGLRAGVRGDGVTHVVVRRWLRQQALCGAGSIRLVLPFPFDPSEHSACRVCAEQVSESSG